MRFLRGRPPAEPRELDRTPQSIPMPVGGFAPVRQRRRASAWARWWWRNSARTVTTVGLVAAVAGAWLALTQPPPAIGLVGGGVSVAGSVLAAAPEQPSRPSTPNGTVMAWGGGSAPAYVLNILQVPAGTLVATAAGSFGGRPFPGRCSLVDHYPEAITESCTFDLAGARLSAEDTRPFDGNNRWARRYSDGSQTTIAVPDGGAVIPVPFPFGR